MGALGNLIPLIVLFVFVGVFGYVGYQMYVFTNELTERGKKKMEKTNVTFTKEGLKVGVKDVRDEDYTGTQQSVQEPSLEHGTDCGSWSKHATQGGLRSAITTKTEDLIRLYLSPVPFGSSAFDEPWDVNLFQA
ncbi:hypothetical protein BJ546DRAFT_1073656 [Cryomyces antarcticus]|nr:hypothetical protein LTR04_000627 [Oleoguttula sp. CCFEE 6159]